METQHPGEHTHFRPLSGEMLCAEVKAPGLLIPLHPSLFKQHSNIVQSEFERDTVEDIKEEVSGFLVCVGSFTAAWLLLCKCTSQQEMRKKWDVSVLSYSHHQPPEKKMTSEIQNVFKTF